MLTDLQRDQLEIVLVSPRNPLNIGAAARAMANFGFSRLTVVAPYEPHWREAQSAVGAEGLLQSARKTGTLQEAVADCTLVLGTGTLTHRKPEQPVVSLPLLTPFIQDKENIAFVFGSEKHGLTRDDLALCHYLVEIPTDLGQPSMNLGQAVAVCLYELARPASPHTLGAPGGATHSGTGEAAPQEDHREPKDKPRANSPATSRDLDLLADVIAQTMAAADYSPATMRNANRHDLHLLLRRLTFSSSDARRALGVFRRILWQFQRNMKPDREPK